MKAFTTGAASDIGLRETNQDAYWAEEGLVAVADGVGGLPAGEVASHLAIETLRAAFGSNPTAEGLALACQEANRAIWHRSGAEADLRGMATTLTALAVTQEEEEGDLVAATVGDSRIYRLRRGQLTQLTTDHTVAAQLIQAGELSETEALNHPHRHVLTRALGVGPNVEADTVEVRCSPGDRLLLCTDGLCHELTLAEIETELGAVADVQGAADHLVRRAASRGARDNVTVVVVDVN